jgi:membrane protein insertase Oxa1/YidC/SpoIIIJ
MYGAEHTGEGDEVAGNVAKRSGMITFAAGVALAAGAYNMLSGIAAVADDDTLASRATDVLYGIDLSVWGWFWVIAGALQLVTGVLILMRNSWGLLLGVGIAFLSALMTVFVIFVFPLWAIAVLTLDFLVAYVLLTRSDEFD